MPRGRQVLIVDDHPIVLTVSTVETHRRNIRRKLDLDSSQELVLSAAQWWDRQSA